MADPADLADEEIERTARYNLAASRKPAGPVPNGVCHYCDAGLPPEMPFCGAECRDEWEHEQHLKKQRTGG